MHDSNADEIASAVAGNIAAVGAVDVVVAVAVRAEQDWRWKLSLQQVEEGSHLVRGVRRDAVVAECWRQLLQVS